MFNDVLYTVNKKYLLVFLASLTSLLRNSNLDNIRIHLVTDDFDKDDFDKVYEVIAKFPGTKINCYNIDWFDIERFDIPDWRGTQIANARLFLSSVIDTHDVHNILYLDADTIVVGDLNGLMDNYSESVIAACYDGCVKSYGDSLGLNKYYNSGVLFINVDKWEEIEAQERILYAIKNTEHELNFPDQDILNIALKDFYDTLPVEYNIAPYIYAFDEKKGKRYFNKDKKYISYEMAKEGMKDPKILHTIGLFGVKPWMENDVNPFNDIFMEYLRSVDPTFTREELPLYKRIFTFNKDLFYTILTARTYLPKSVEEKARKLSLNLQQQKKKK